MTSEKRSPHAKDPKYDDCKYLYRFEDSAQAKSLYVRRFKVLSHTEQGCWISYQSNLSGQKFVLQTAHKQFAHPNQKEALQSYIRRKEKQITILKSRLSAAKEYLEVAEYTVPVEGQATYGTSLPFKFQFPFEDSDEMCIADET